MNISEYFHITPALQDLHWLPVRARIHFKILILVFKAIHGLATPYIRDLISVRSKSSYNLKSNSSLLLEPPKKKMLSTLGARSFYAAAPCLWNSQPAELREFQSLTIFKRKRTFFGQVRQEIRFHLDLFLANLILLYYTTSLFH